MASSVDTYGTFSANKVEVDSIIKFTGSTDDSKSISIQLAGNPSQAGDVVYSLPVITSGKTLATTDDVTALPSSSNNQVLVSNSGTYASVNVSGDLTNSAGAFSIGNDKVTTAKILNANVTSAKIADANVTLAKVEAVNDGQIIVGNGSNRPTAVAVSGDITLSNTGAVAIASGVIVNADVNASAAIAGSKIDPDFGSQTVETTGDIQVASNKALRFGSDANGVWRIAIAGGGASLLIQKKEGGAWVTKSSIAA